MEQDWAGRLRLLYRDLDAELARLGVACRGCGECCHFDKVDHILYASELERRLLAVDAVPSSNPDASVEQLSGGLRCPFQERGRCMAREGRVLGCRLHFCSWPEHGDEFAFTENWHGRLKALHDDLGVEWGYRPLLPWRG